MYISPLRTPRVNDFPSLPSRPVPVVLQRGRPMCPGRRREVVQKSHRTLLLLWLLALPLVVPRLRLNNIEDGQQRSATPILMSTAHHTPSNPIFMVRRSAGITEGTRMYLCSLVFITTIISGNTSSVCLSPSDILISSHNIFPTLWRHTILNGPLHFFAKVVSHCYGPVVQVSISSTCGFVLRDTTAGYSGWVVTSVLAYNKSVLTRYTGHAMRSRGF